jgi:starch-binding outer membrane protein, SusD/RagB family
MKKLFIYIFLINLFGCAKFIEVGPPITSVNDGNVYEDDATATAVLTGIYISLSNDNSAGLSGLMSMNLFPALSADELTLYSTSVSEEVLGYYTNNIKSNLISTDFYGKSYATIFSANAALNGLNNSKSLTSSIKNQLLGEAHFVRAFCYFNLINIFGEVPLITSIDYNETALQPKADSVEIIDLIKADLKIAQNLLSQDYLDGSLKNISEERIRPSRAAATALLARIYLYIRDWNNAEIEASKVIENNLYENVPLNVVFLANSKETIWSIKPVGSDNNANTGEGKIFILPDVGPGDFHQYILSDRQRNAFEPGDQRYKYWVDSITVGTQTYYYPFKYKVPDVVAPTTEYSIVFRFAEQFLIRAEARIQLGNISNGITDINTLRARATDYTVPVNNQLKALSTSLTKDAALQAVLHERQVELFTEWGHRWLDLKRTDKIDEVMSAVTPLKGGIWDSRWALYPFPLSEIRSNPKLLQNPGY